jgi:hypothetical protein
MSRWQGLDTVGQDRLCNLHTASELVDRWQRRINLYPHLLRNGGAAVADNDVQQYSLSVIGAYVGPYVWLGCVDAQLLLDLRLFLGSHGRARSCLRRPPAEVQRPQSDQRCGDRHPGPTTHPGRVSVSCAAAGSSPGWFLCSSGVRRPEARSRGGFHIPRLGPPPFHAPPVGRSCSGRGRLQDALVCGIKWTLLGRYTLAELVNLILANAARQGHSSDSALLQGGSDEDERHGSPTEDGPEPMIY